MRKIKYNILALSLLAAAFSCSDDDFSREYVDNEVKNELVGSLTMATNLVSPGSQVKFNFTLPQSFDVESTVEVRATSTFSEFPNPLTEVVLVTVAAGSTTGEGSIVMPGSIGDLVPDYFGIPDYTTVFIDGIALDSSEDPFTLTSNEVIINSQDANVPYHETRDQVLMASLDWAGPYDENDLDLIIVDASGNIIESSFSGTRFEGDFFNNPNNEAHPDGDYDVLVDVYAIGTGATVAWQLQLTEDSGVATHFSGEATETGTLVVTSFNKSTDADGNAVYTYL
jgi:hypothetical protein